MTKLPSIELSNENEKIIVNTLVDFKLVNKNKHFLYVERAKKSHLYLSKSKLSLFENIYNFTEISHCFIFRITYIFV